MNAILKTFVEDVKYVYLDIKMEIGLILIYISIYLVFHNVIDDGLYVIGDKLFDNQRILNLLFVLWSAVNIAVLCLVCKLNIDLAKRFDQITNMERLKYLHYIKVFIVMLFCIVVWYLLQVFWIKHNSTYVIIHYFYWILMGLLVLNVFFVLFFKKRLEVKGENDISLKSDVPEKYYSNIDQNLRSKVDDLSSIINSVFSSASLINEQSYVIGINGEWGSGKTTLIELVKDKIQPNILVVSYNPWMSHQPANLAIDFFKTIANRIGGVLMKRTLVKYGIALSKAYKREYGDALDYATGELSLNSRFEDICKYIKRKRLKLLIIIDDIDRMDGNEIFSVLKLVRSSGNMPNTIYLLAFNHVYINDQIQEKIRYNSVVSGTCKIGRAHV